MPRLYATATLGVSAGTKWIYNAPAGDDIDADNDGVMTPNHACLVDLSDLASQMLGQQVPQSARYTVRRIWMGMKNVDDAVDNDESTFFGGTIRWYYPTQHRLNALSLARSAEKYDEASEVDADSFFLNSAANYNAVRFGWRDDDASEWESDQIRFQTSEDFSGVIGSQWNLGTIFDIYNAMNPPTNVDSLWAGRAGNAACKVPWTCAVASGVGAGDAPAIRTDYNSGVMDADCLAGLLYVVVADSSGDEAGEVDDDYYLTMGIEFDVGVDA